MAVGHMLEDQVDQLSGAEGLVHDGNEVVARQKSLSIELQALGGAQNGGRRR